MNTDPDFHCEWDTVIIGGGASGMLAALQLSQLRPNSSVLIVERNPKLGKKLLMTGNGRCNLSNIGASVDYYHGSDPTFVCEPLRKYAVDDTREFFEQLGLPTMSDEFGRVYPNTQNAGSVLDCLRYNLSDYGVSVMLSTLISSVEYCKGRFILRTHNEEVIRSKSVLVATGGACAPHTGSDGNGYDILSSFGHMCLNVMPGIVQIKTRRDWVKQLSGIRLSANIALLFEDKCVREEFGEILFTDYGVSGPASLQLSSHVSRILHENDIEHQKALSLHIDFFSDMSISDIRNELMARRAKYSHRAVNTLLVGLVQNRLATALIRSATDISFSEPISNLSDSDVVAISNRLKDSILDVEGTMGMKEAQVTIGGALTSEFDPTTMMSVYVPGLFAAGEVLDIDGDCGGFNLQWAFSSGRLAADGINIFLSGIYNE